jgi:hypothetical protein
VRTSITAIAMTSAIPLSSARRRTRREGGGGGTGEEGTGDRRIIGLTVGGAVEAVAPRRRDSPDRTRDMQRMLPDFGVPVEQGIYPDERVRPTRIKVTEPASSPKESALGGHSGTGPAERALLQARASGACRGRPVPVARPG